MDIIFFIGRILYGGLLLLMGLNHFMKADAMKGYARSKGVPFPGLSVFVTGLVLTLGALGVILGAYIQVSLWLIVLFMFVVSIKIHKFWIASDPQAKMAEMTQFMKNMVILGAALMMLMLSTPWPFALNL